MYPALSVLQALQHRANGSGEAGGDERPGIEQAARFGFSAPEGDLTVLWVGAAGGMEADLVKRAGIRFETIPAGQVHGINLRALPRNLWNLGRGFLAARRVLRKFRPDVLLFTGGYLAVPMAFASRLLRKGRRLLYVPDIEPGWALKTLARFADHIAITVEESRAFFPQAPNVTVTGYPLRHDPQAGSKAEARAVFAFQEDLPLLLVMGGSKGARSINQALQAALPELLRHTQVLHLSGSQEWALVERSRQSLPVELQRRYRAYPYLHNEMGAALQAADLVLSRAGASILGEYPAYGLPAILVPYPYAWRYQRVNAQYLQEHGAALLLEDADLMTKMLPLVRELLQDRERADRMRQAMRSLAQPQAAAKIAALIDNLAAAASEARH